MKRTAISKKTRFEVFKRDGFKCQYCGRSAPDVLLHIDHIKPLAHGGDNSIFNLITACADCNLGKGARELGDSAEINKQKAQLEEINERRLQLQLLMQWRDELNDIRMESLEYASSHYEDIFNCTLTDNGRGILLHEIDQFGLTSVLDAMDITKIRQRIAPNERLRYMAGICWNKKRENK